MNAPILDTRDALRAAVIRWRKAGETIAVVPTMGALHAGHLSLVTAAKAACDRVIVTIFVNPKQFNQASDLENYPRTEQEDARKLAPFDVDLIYVPDVTQIYGAGFATNVSVSNMTDVLCGADRPGHFDGVATVVSKLFLQTSADQAFFGEKDFQQLMVVRRMASDLDIPIDVIGCPTVRESDGLAMSSRNLLLSKDARSTAPILQRIMQDVSAKLASGAAFEPLQDEAKSRLMAQGFSKIDYFDLRSQSTLATLSHPTEPARLFAAAWLDGVRLIDNIDVPF